MPSKASAAIQDQKIIQPVGRRNKLHLPYGRAMLDELAGQLQRLGAHVADVASALCLTAARIRDAMTASF